MKGRRSSADLSTDDDDFADVFDSYDDARPTLQDLEEEPVHVAWRLEDRDGRDTKVPYAAVGNGPAKADDPTTWGTLKQAKRRARALLANGRKGGVGIQLCEIADGRRIGGLDLDTCRDPDTGKFEPWATDLIDRLRTYGEVSPSGTGAKLFFTFDGAQLARLRKAMGTSHTRSFKRGKGAHPPAIELSLSNRYFTVTGQRLSNCPIHLAHLSATDLLRIIERDGPTFARGKSDQTSARDDSRSGKAFRLAISIKALGGSLDDFAASLSEDTELAAWAEDDRQVERAWNRAPALALGAKGKPLSNLANALATCRTLPELAGLFRYDEMAQEIVLMRPIPVFGGPAGSNFAEPARIGDTDIIRFQEYLQQSGLTALSKDSAHNAADVIAKENSFHPVRVWLASLKWDDVPRLDTWLSRYMGAEDTAYIRQVGRMALLGMVARIRSPGCKLDHMLILEGGQGASKSTALSILGDRWFSDALPDLKAGKDVSQHLRGKWLIEIAELDALRKAEAAQLKAFISRQREQYRPSYGRCEVVEPRQCIFVGTTNEDRYLKDTTGNRRFWPVKVADAFDANALRRDRDQLFAEAWDALTYWNEPWWPDREFERTYMRSEQDKRRELDPWLDVIADHLEFEDQVTLRSVALNALDLQDAALDHPKQNRIVQCLRALGWQPEHKRTGNVWRRPCESDSEPR
jgi:predicted P-loop ATPase